MRGLRKLVGVQRAKQFDKLAVAAPRHGQNELQLATAWQRDGPHFLEVVGRQQASISHGNDALDGEPLDDLLDRWHEGFDLRRVAVEHLVVERQAVSGLHHAEHDLACDHALFGHAEFAHIAVLLGQPSGANGGHVVEHHGQILVDQGPQQASQHTLDFIVMFDQGIHGAQQMLVLDRLSHGARQTNSLHPSKHAELGLRVAQAVEHHDTNERFDINGVAGAAKDAPKSIKAERIPKLSERPNVTEIARGLEAHGGRRRCSLGSPAGHAQQARDDGIELGAELVESAQGGDGALLGSSRFVAIGLDQLNVAART